VTQIGSNTTEFSVAIPGHPENTIRLAWAATTDVGLRRAANEDSFLAQSPIFAVADGMGGHAAGDLASAAVVNRLSEVNTTDFLETAQIDAALLRATEDIDVVAVGSALGVGTTATGVVLTMLDGNPYFAVFNIGDSRVYAYDNGNLYQVTVDHSVVQEMVDAGMLTREQAERHPDSNIITRAVGFGSPPSPDYWMLPLTAGTRLLVCSDGLNKELGDEDILAHLAADQPARQTADALVVDTLAAGGRDNVTIIVIDILEAPINLQHGTDVPQPGVDTQ